MALRLLRQWDFDTKVTPLEVRLVLCKGDEEVAAMDRWFLDTSSKRNAPRSPAVGYGKIKGSRSGR